MVYLYHIEGSERRPHVLYILIQIKILSIHNSRSYKHISFLFPVCKSIYYFLLLTVLSLELTSYI